MRIYGEITKMEPQPDGTIKVIGVASTGAIDDADETVLPEAMKELSARELDELKHGVRNIGRHLEARPAGAAKARARTTA